MLSTPIGVLVFRPGQVMRSARLPTPGANSLRVTFSVPVLLSGPSEKGRSFVWLPPPRMITAVTLMHLRLPWQTMAHSSCRSRQHRVMGPRQAQTQNRDLANRGGVLSLHAVRGVRCKRRLLLYLPGYPWLRCGKRRWTHRRTPSRRSMVWSW